MLRISRLKWRLIGAAASVAATVAVLGFVPWQVPHGPWRNDAVQRLSAALDARSLTVGDMRIALLPLPRLQLVDVSMEQHGGGLSARVPAAMVNLALGPLLRGKAKPASLALAEPEIAIAAPPQQDQAFRNVSDLLTSAGVIFSANKPLNGLRKIVISHGRMHVRPASSSNTSTYDNVNLRLTLPRSGKTLAASVTALHEGNDIRVAFNGPLPGAGVGLEPLTISYWSNGLSFEFDGKGAVGPKAALIGSLIGRAGAKGTSPFTSLFAGLGMSQLPPFDWSSQIDASERGANLSDLRLTIGADRFDGAGQVRHDGQRWHIGATLAAERASLADAFGYLSYMRGGDGSWNTARIDMDALFATNIDLRLSADQLHVGDQQWGKVAATVTTRATRAEAILSDAREKGTGRLRLLATPGRDGIDLKVTAGIDRTDLGALVTQLTRTRRFTGNGNASLALDTSGRTIAQFVANADGKVSFAVHDGDLIGIDLNRLANRRSARPERALVEALGGSTPFESATLIARISGGAANPVDGYLQGGRIVGSLAGTVDFAQGVHNLTGNVVQMPGETFVVEPLPVIDFSITGPLSEPRVIPNMTTLLKRS